MNNLADPPSLIDLMDSVLDAGADLAQALQDIVDDPTQAIRTDLVELIDAWEEAYRLSLPLSDEEPE